MIILIINIGILIDYSNYQYWNSYTNKWQVETNSTVHLGTNAGLTGQGPYAVAIGNLAGDVNQHQKTIILNASGTSFTSQGENRFYVNPVRAVTSITWLKQLYYDPSNNEIVYYNI